METFEGKLDLKPWHSVKASPKYLTNLLQPATLGGG